MNSKEPHRPTGRCKGMVMRPLLRYGALYVVAELAAVALLVWAVGLGWTLVLLAVTFMVGVVLAASQLKGQVAAVRRTRRNPQRAVADGVLVGLGSFLVFLPGILSTAAGALMLAPPTRTAMRPLAATLLSRGVVRGMGVMNLDQYAGNQFGSTRTGRGDYIDGEVLGEAGAEQVHRPAAGRAVVARRAGF